MAEQTDQRLIDIQLDEKTMVRRKPEVEHERAVAIYDLLEENSFTPAGELTGPYRLHLSLEDNRLIFDIRGEDGGEQGKVSLPLLPFKTIVKDYFMICESYYTAIRKSSPSQIEAIDMGRRAMHNEGSQLLRDRLNGKIEIDSETARRLFTLICVLHIRG